MQDLQQKCSHLSTSIDHLIAKLQQAKIDVQEGNHCVYLHSHSIENAAKDITTQIWQVAHLMRIQKT
ncbi:hypothetical protein G7B40_024640 [Aetokthonos hydrillicola Thurmond2011]|jgi:hypothetical protein|uniref:Uncharacterized protein n=1 Tax=Aetokthonos hydrillicola Thurmond2011 TaxID=2712845 RepID=A0AAP5ICI7_9CYAN|nr:hypothetical protein [Aetokthonos hydrillicola]MBO3461574.1 hypothetical protein [Aetokthonos hydrillicola CCALA 1050]MBW4586124.1 hypothetical protein [Aetokthonos hydrillicola CCALA 1050]MDR9897729.1 hypothetical protein [Aetokthonos hydrillicola Thurmond2011]